MPAAVAVAMFGGALAAPLSAATLQNFDIVVTAFERGTYVSLTDCPAGKNIVNGYIRPTEAADREYLTVRVQVTVVEGLTAGDHLGRLSLQDSSGHIYYTAQTLIDVGNQRHFSCGFSFRVPKGSRPVRLFIGDQGFDIAS